MAQAAAARMTRDLQVRRELETRIQRGFELLRAGRAAEAAADLAQAAKDHPLAADLLALWAQAEQLAGNGGGALSAAKASLTARPTTPWARAMLARVLLLHDHAPEALSVCAEPPATAEILAVRAEAQTTLGQPRAAIETFAELLDLVPSPAPVRHNMASLFTDLGEFPAAEREARAAIAGGLDAPEAWLVLGRALQGQDRHTEAEAAYREAIVRRPAFAEAHGHLANLVWMRTGDVQAAVSELSRALVRLPDAFDLLAARARVLEDAGESEAAYRDAAEAAARSGNPWLELAAAQAALSVAPAQALRHADRAFAAGVRTPNAFVCLAEANLAVGRPERAVECAQAILGQDANHQRALCLLATAFRLLGDRRYEDLVDYDRMVRSFRLDTPGGWSSLDAFLVDLAMELAPLHGLSAHPVGQSLRGGTQTQQNLLEVRTPAVQALLRAFDEPIRRYIAADALPNWGRSPHFRITGTWSVRLAPGGRHVSHMHPSGRISSACHIELPPAISTGRQGWLSFGEPDIPTAPALGAEHFVEPRCGHVVLFPSYLCHGTTPFAGPASRLTVAFDVAPAEVSS